MNRPLHWVAGTLGLKVVDALDRMVTGWSTDTRTLGEGDLFLALRGPNFDGSRYAAQALQQGAVAAVVDGSVEIEENAEGAGPVFRVDDTLAALQSLARKARTEWRASGKGEVVAVTGSAGKTSTKDVIAQMLAVKYKTAKTEGNLNNHIGLPLSLLRLDEAARVAVLELGMNHAGEIRELARLAAPQVGVVTNVGYAHIEAFEGIDGIAAAKRELIEELGPEGIAVLNADDERVAAMSKQHAGRTVTYGQSASADVRAENVAFSNDRMRFTVSGVAFETQLQGRHSLSNILAGLAVAGSYGISAEELITTVRELKPGKMRGERIERNGITIYNDCYNSNPDAVRAMLDVLEDTPAQRRIAVLGEMRELGRWAEPLHQEVGSYASRCNVDVLVGIRGAACYMLDAAKRAGLRADAAFFFEDPAEAGEMLRQMLQPGDAVLFKGSRGVEVEKALAKVLDTTADASSMQKESQ